jgi:hypothetical protein
MVVNPVSAKFEPEIFSVAFIQENKDLKRPKCQNKPQNIIFKPRNIMSMQPAIIRRQPNTMRPAITKKPRTMLMSHMDIIYMQLIITRKQRNTTWNITAGNRTSTKKNQHRRR